MMKNKFTNKNKEKILFFILESSRNCTEYIYLKLLKDKKIDDLKYEIIAKKIGPDYTTNKILEIKDVKNIKTIILLKDNDLKEYTEKNVFQDVNTIKNILLTNEIIDEKVTVERYGIPGFNITFDSFLLAHFETVIFTKNKSSKDKTIEKLKNLLGENFKGDTKKIEKVFVSNYLIHLKENLKNFDDQYSKLVNLIFKSQ